jgi:X-X-X-Leu-X-X-Gly heptad repeat protein
VTDPPPPPPPPYQPPSPQPPQPPPGQWAPPQQQPPSGAATPPSNLAGYSVPPGYPDQPTPPPPMPGGSKRGLLIAGVLLLVLVLAAGAVFLLTRPKSAPVSQSTPTPAATASPTAAATTTAAGTPTATADAQADNITKLETFCASNPTPKDDYDKAALTDFCNWVATIRPYHNSCEVTFDATTCKTAADAVSSAAQAASTDLASQHPTSTADQQADPKLKQGYQDIAAGTAGVSKGITDTSSSELSAGATQYKTGAGEVGNGMTTLGH